MGRSGPVGGLSLRSHEGEGVLGAEHMTVQVSDPLPPRRRHVQVANGFFQVRRDAGPIKVGKAIDQIRR
jgi:hypothetical protein